uniref:Mitogen-activated protein kinase n=1 Tax=Chromera velia CCMP2878 TaxID=1169474 RepID=A0A0G4FVX7_9ALVE|eukprot:Cvel_19024.t1-p1 / transcript=Cvel_19024.t1 / gene=Cvel_19024 / organism=Chromera_velia_CCMP2878 / gene_product=Mitogen-activated protein kinase 6, putative / transcript_product=Mitogen-activated protein kinase 6, putative / location=Cvel_scaffold1611:24465-27370(-) / protein_length=745 / sequence_SO=supercontig / SO=protein_coding / is_pseudo=false
MQAEEVRSEGCPPPLHRKFFEVTLNGRTFVIEDKFRPIRTIGHGSYGTVCMVQNLFDGSFSAIKKMDHAFENGVFAKRALREVRILRFLKDRHENVMDVEDVYCSGGSADNYSDVYLRSGMMQTDLNSVLSSRQPLSEEHHRFFMFQLLSSLDFMHRAGVLHRDIKPRNILLNQDCDLRVCDFGLARTVPRRQPAAARSLNTSAVTPTTLPSPSTAPGSPDFPSPVASAASAGPHAAAEGGVPGAPVPVPQDGGAPAAGGRAANPPMTSYVATRWYRAPELIWGSGDYDGRVDVWAAGCVLAEMLGHGKVLFPGRDSRDQLEQIVLLLGLPDPDVMAEIPEGARRFMQAVEDRHLREHGPRTSESVREILGEKFPEASEKCLDLLAGMLAVHPSQRLSAAACLRAPWFDEGVAGGDEDEAGQERDGEGDVQMGGVEGADTRLLLPAEKMQHPSDVMHDAAAAADADEAQPPLSSVHLHQHLDAQLPLLTHLMPVEAFAFEQDNGRTAGSLPLYRRELLREQAHWHRQIEERYIEAWRRERQEEQDQEPEVGGGELELVLREADGEGHSEGEIDIEEEAQQDRRRDAAFATEVSHHTAEVMPSTPQAQTAVAAAAAAHTPPQHFPSEIPNAEREAASCMKKDTHAGTEREGEERCNLGGSSVNTPNSLQQQQRRGEAQASRAPPPAADADGGSADRPAPPSAGPPSLALLSNLLSVWQRSPHHRERDRLSKGRDIPPNQHRQTRDE